LRSPKLLCAFAIFATAVPAMPPRPPSPVPVVLDTDIGTDIDDAYSLAMILESPQLRLRAVTTVSGDAAARARIAAKMLAVSGHPEIPVAAGAQDKRDAFAQAQWAANYHGANLVSTGAVQLLKQAIEREHGRAVILAIGPLTNIAALLRQYPGDKPLIHTIALMGGSIARGYTPGSAPVPEYNVAADAAAAQAVFASGIPIAMAPLDVTAQLQLTARERADLDALDTPLTEALRQLYTLWDTSHIPWAPRDSDGHAIPTLHDAMAVALLTEPSLCQQARVHVVVTTEGKTIVEPGPPNASVALHTAPARFLQSYLQLFSR
jgi:purine nucleosidase